MRLFAALLMALAHASPDAFLASLYVPGPGPATLLARTAPEQPSCAIYDVALASLRELEQGHQEQAGQLLAGMVAVQRADGSLPFSFRLPKPDDGPPYLRAGAMAWVGYAAARYLNDGPGGPARNEIAAMAHKLAAHLLATRVQKAGDGRDGLVLGGSGGYRYELAPNGEVKERFVPGEVVWVSTEHNVDVYFFLDALGHATGTPRYLEEAREIARALQARLWSDEAGQFWQGATASGPDKSYALDCASWGALFLLAAGQRERAQKAYITAEARYGTADPSAFVLGHKPYVHRPVIENRALAEHYKAEVPTAAWDDLPAVWPEGSAGVALAALRLGYKERARSILEELDRLRETNGGLPGLTRAIPLEFEKAPALAGTAWAAMVQQELDAKPGYVGLWAR
ncbi:MAG: hypothetical protein JWM80_1611 [Cyanobacteria bacterium RYN_339]|nr:hypothetical protein [Cyanobacteria bacterium RYN_339]